MKRLLLFISSFLIATALAAVLYFSLAPEHAKLRDTIMTGDLHARLAAASRAVSFEQARFRSALGSSKATYTLARFYATGDFGPDADSKSLTLLKASADRGYPPAELSVARLYFLGQGGVAKDDKQGAAWVQKAAVAGSSYAQALMGMLQIAGIGLEQDGDKAIDWLKKSKEHEAPLILERLQGDMKALEALPPEERRRKTEEFYARKKAEISQVFQGLMDEVRAAESRKDAAPESNSDDDSDDTDDNTNSKEGN
ncbi:MAG: tetratricopeptide repeat protein [Micavibrio sp.]|nr:tetratricopeptide repeat protein [Micavibrio sp.]